MSPSWSSAGPRRTRPGRGPRHRIGQDDSVTAWYLLAAETIDESMAELIESKRGIVGAVTDGRRDESEAVVQSVIRALRGKPLRRLRAVA